MQEPLREFCSSAKCPNSRALRKPQPLFKKLDESVVEEELARIGAAPPA